MPTILENANILTPFEKIDDSSILIDDAGKISSIGYPSTLNISKYDRFDVQEKFVIPGFIDIHVHGGFGIAFGSGDLANDLKKYSKWVAGSGETGFILSITGPEIAFIEHIIREYVNILPQNYADAQPLGLHLEGPFLNPERHGAFNPKWIHLPNLDETRRYLKAGEGWIKHMSLAPEFPESENVAKLLSDSGVVASLGHSNTDYDTAASALKNHFAHVTHTFNAQSPLNHRQPGVVGAVLASDGVTAELIADGMHVNPAAMKILVRCLSAERIVLITDAMQAAGLSDGEYELLEQKVSVKDGKATLSDGTLAGSTATVNQCVHNMVKFVGVPLKDAVRMATYNPAKVIGEHLRMGSIEPGKLANLAVIDEDVKVYMTFVAGKLIFSQL